MTDDEMHFGADTWVYCKQHLRPHVTGWCTVSPDEKIKLAATTRDEAVAEAKRMGLRIFSEEFDTRLANAAKARRERA